MYGIFVEGAGVFKWLGETGSARGVDAGWGWTSQLEAM